MIFGEKERRKVADTYFSVCLSHLPLSLSLNIQMRELGKSQVFRSNRKTVEGFPLLSGGFGELTSPLRYLLGLPCCKKLDFS